MQHQPWNPKRIQIRQAKGSKILSFYLYQIDYSEGNALRSCSLCLVACNSQPARKFMEYRMFDSACVFEKFFIRVYTYISLVLHLHFSILVWIKRRLFAFLLFVLWVLKRNALSTEYHFDIEQYGTAQEYHWARLLSFRRRRYRCIISTSASLSKRKHSGDWRPGLQSTLRRRSLGMAFVFIWTSKTPFSRRPDISQNKKWKFSNMTPKLQRPVQYGARCCIQYSPGNDVHNNSFVFGAKSSQQWSLTFNAALITGCHDRMRLQPQKETYPILAGHNFQCMELASRFRQGRGSSDLFSEFTTSPAQVLLLQVLFLVSPRKLVLVDVEPLQKKRWYLQTLVTFIFKNKSIIFSVRVYSKGLNRVIVTAQFFSLIFVTVKGVYKNTLKLALVIQ